MMCVLILLPLSVWELFRGTLYHESVLLLSIPLIHHLCSIYHHGPPGGQAPRHSSISQVKARMMTMKNKTMEQCTLDTKTIDDAPDSSMSHLSSILTLLVNLGYSRQ